MRVKIETWVLQILFSIFFCFIVNEYLLPLRSFLIALFLMPLAVVAGIILGDIAFHRSESLSGVAIITGILCAGIGMAIVSYLAPTLNSLNQLLFKFSPFISICVGFGLPIIIGIIFPQIAYNIVSGKKRKFTKIPLSNPKL